MIIQVIFLDFSMAIYNTCNILVTLYTLYRYDVIYLKLFYNVFVRIYYFDSKPFLYITIRAIISQ